MENNVLNKYFERHLRQKKQGFAMSNLQHKDLNFVLLPQSEPKKRGVVESFSLFLSFITNYHLHYNMSYVRHCYFYRLLQDVHWNRRPIHLTFENQAAFLLHIL